MWQKSVFSEPNFIKLLRVLLQHRHFKISCITCYISYESLKHIFHFKFRVGKKLIFSMVETWTKKHINNGETFSALLFMKWVASSRFLGQILITWPSGFKSRRPRKRRKTNPQRIFHIFPSSDDCDDYSKYLEDLGKTIMVICGIPVSLLAFRACISCIVHGRLMWPKTINAYDDSSFHKCELHHLPLADLIPPSSSVTVTAFSPFDACPQLLWTCEITDKSIGCPQLKIKALEWI